MSLLSKDRRICAKCGKIPIPPYPIGRGKRARRCLRCMHDAGNRWDMTLSAIAEREGLEVAKAAALESGLDFPEWVEQRVRAKAQKKRGAKTKDQPVTETTGDLRQPPIPMALAEDLLAAGLGITEDPERAAELVGLDIPNPVSLAEGLKDHPLRHADPGRIAHIVAQTATITALKALLEVGRGDSTKTARYGMAVRRLLDAHESLTGGARPLPPKISLDFQVMEAKTVH